MSGIDLWQAFTRHTGNGLLHEGLAYYPGDATAESPIRGISVLYSNPGRWYPIDEANLLEAARAQMLRAAALDATDGEAT